MSCANGYHNDNSKMDEDFEEIKIDVPWGHIAGKWWGPRHVQPVITFHGWQDNAGSFDTLAPLLISSDISILSIDLPGHGFSTHYPIGQFYYLFWDGIMCIRRIVKYYNWRNINIMGHSLGGAIAFVYAAVYPDEVDKYIALDIPAPVVKSSSINVGECIDKYLSYEKLHSDEGPSWEYEEVISIVENAYKDNLSRTFCEILMKRGMAPLEKDNSLFAFSRDIRLKTAAIGLFSDQEVSELATKIKCKVLNIRAESGFFKNQVEYYDSVIDKIRTNAALVEYYTVPGTHHVHLSNPERISDIILKFLKL